MARKKERQRRQSAQTELRGPPFAESRAVWLSTVVLGLLTFGVYSRSLENDFINWDDPRYVAQNPDLEQGLTPGAVRWAFTSTVAANWHPLTWLSHGLDVTLWTGQEARGHHLTNVVLHAANASLLLLLLYRLTRRLWPSTVVAALFALHPLHVESVAWIAERKDILCGFFMFLTMLAYVAWLEHPALRRYGLVVLCFAAALLSKPMAVTLPLVLLLLDYWPLKRLSWKTAYEKIPLLFMSVASSIITMYAQQAGGAVRDAATLPLTTRMAHAVYAYAMYLWKAVWPAPGSLVPLYPLPDKGGDAIPPWLVAALLAGLVLLTAAAVWLRRSRPYLVVGWLMYAGMLVPVIGVVQVGSQVMADRYTYVPLVGVFLAAVWLVDSLVTSRQWARAAAGAATVALTALALLTWQQQAVWRDSLTLWSRVVEVYPRSPTALNQLGQIYSGTNLGAVRPDYRKAASYYRRALEMEPGNSMLCANLANNLLRLGQDEEAERLFLHVLSIDDHNAGAHNNYGTLLRNRGRYDEAIRHFKRALELAPDHHPARLNWGLALFDKGLYAEAVAKWQEVPLASRDNPQLHGLMAQAYDKLGRPDEAARCRAEAERCRLRRPPSSRDGPQNRN